MINGMQTKIHPSPLLH